MIISDHSGLFLLRLAVAKPVLERINAPSRLPPSLKLRRDKSARQTGQTGLKKPPRDQDSRCGEDVPGAVHPGNPVKMSCLGHGQTPVCRTQSNPVKPSRTLRLTTHRPTLQAGPIQQRRKKLNAKAQRRKGAKRVLRLAIQPHQTVIAWRASIPFLPLLLGVLASWR
jgi:hypothetical protein